jgi:hypothetical protein
MRYKIYIQHSKKEHAMQNTKRTIKLVNVHTNNKNELCATLTDGAIAVQCEDVLYLDFVDEQAMHDTYDEWCELANAGEDGYNFVA